MKITKSMSIALVALAAAGCAKETTNPESPSVESPVPFTISVQTSAPQVKTVIDEKFQTTWVAEDAINVYHAAAGSNEIKSDGAFVLESDNTFKGELSEGLKGGESYDWYAFYPHSDAFASPAQISVTIPASLTAESGVTHIAGNSDPLFGKIAGVSSSQTPSITMQHLLSVAEVVVHNNSLVPITVSSISIEASEYIAGDFTVDITSGTPVFTANGTGSKIVTLTLPSEMTLKPSSAEKFYIGIKPFTASKGSDLKLSINGTESKSITLQKEVTFSTGRIKALNFNHNGPTFTVNASGKKVVFSMGNLWYGHEASNREFRIASSQNETLTPESNWNGASFNGNYIQHFIWSDNKYDAYAIVAKDVTWKTTDRLFAADGGAVEGWTVLTKDEWNYLLNERTVNGGKGAGYSYFNSGIKNGGYKADGKAIKGIFIFPDDYAGKPAVIGNKTLSWETVNEAGIAYLPAAGGYSQRASTDNGWVSTADFTGAYMSGDIFTNGSGVNTFCTVRFNQNSSAVTINTSPKLKYGYTIRLVKVVE